MLGQQTGMSSGSTIFCRRRLHLIKCLFGYHHLEIFIVYRLQQIANTIDDALFNAGLSENRNSADVELHMTVINTKYYKSVTFNICLPKTSQIFNSLIFQNFKRFIDASVILENFGTLQLGTVEANEVNSAELSHKISLLNKRI